MNDVPGVIVYSATGLLGTGSTVAASVWTWKLVRPPDYREAMAAGRSSAVRRAYRLSAVDDDIRRDSVMRA